MLQTENKDKKAAAYPFLQTNGKRFSILRILTGSLFVVFSGLLLFSFLHSFMTDQNTKAATQTVFTLNGLRETETVYTTLDTASAQERLLPEMRDLNKAFLSFVSKDNEAYRLHLSIADKDHKAQKTKNILLDIRPSKDLFTVRADGFPPEGTLRLFTKKASLMSPVPFDWSGQMTLSYSLSAFFSGAKESCIGASFSETISRDLVLCHTKDSVGEPA